jgi:hypothetical protein
VLTAIVVSQVSVGGSLRATVEYNIGTLVGAVYAAAVGLAIPHGAPISQAVALVASVAPMAVAAAINPAFRVAPFSAVLVLLIGSELGESPIASALTRVVEVAIGGAVAVLVSLVVFPERAHGMGLEAASRILNQMAELLPQFLAKVSRDVDRVSIGLAQSRLGDSVTKFQGLAEEAKRERMVSIVRDPDPTALARMLLRIRHDFVMLGRATVEPFPEAIARRLESPLGRFGEEATAYLSGSAVRWAPPTSSSFSRSGSRSNSSPGISPISPRASRSGQGPAPPKRQSLMRVARTRQAIRRAASRPPSRMPPAVRSRRTGGR